MADIVLAMTGASGAVYSVRLLQVLLAARKTVHLTLSPAAVQVLHAELGLSVNLQQFELSQLIPPDEPVTQDSKLNLLKSQSNASVLSESDAPLGRVVYHHYQDYSAGIASGSFRTAGMVICPCSMGTLGSIANGLSTNLIHRAADVHLKERRKLIVVPRETPLGSIQLENMKRLADAGAVVLPAMPGFYHNPLTIHDLVDFVVGRICDQLGIGVDLFRRWGTS
jgi:4-hydroxy-3-polyprenylbenzoate decarboxylase